MYFTLFACCLLLASATLTETANIRAVSNVDERGGRGGRAGFDNGAENGGGRAEELAADDVSTDPYAYEALE